MFHVGQLVVCVDDEAVPKYVNGGWTVRRLGLDGLKKGTVYTIRDVGREPWITGDSVWLEEIIRPLHPVYGEQGYAAARFRPLSDTKLAAFRSLLVTPPREIVPAD